MGTGGVGKAGFVLGLLAAVGTALPRAGRPASSGGPAAHDLRSEIQAVLDAQVAAWNRGDLEGFMGGYWKSSEFVYISNAKVFRGWQSVLDRYHETFRSGEVQMGVLTLEQTEIEDLGADSALVFGTYRVDPPDGKKRGGLYTLVLRKLPEGWRTVYDRTSSEPR
jgi:beta-aspartyl-peptidase (threonine type)